MDETHVDRARASDRNAATPATRIVVDLQPAPGRDTFAEWSHMLAWLARHTLLDESDRPHFAASVRLTNFEGLDVSLVRVSHAVEGVRTISDVERTGVSQIAFRLFLQGGERGRYGATHMIVRQGDIVIIDFAQPFEITHEPNTIITVSLPRERLLSGLRDRNLHGRIARPGSPAVDMLVAHMHALDAASDRGLTIAEGQAAGQALLMLAEAVFGAAATATPGTTDRKTQDLYTRACVFIEENLSDPGLSPNRMAGTLGVSRASLYRLFERDGGVGAYIRERRLLRIHEIIAIDLAPQSSLGEVAAGQGFAGEAQFNRAFKERFGISPGAARKAAQARRRRGEPLEAPPYTPGIASVSWRTDKY